ncbi:alpha/beta hydrolase family protein [Nonomuraea rubra]
MRPFELGLVVAEALACLGLAFRPVRVFAMFALVIPVAVVAQVLVEGARWPMAPAYALAAALTGLWARRAVATVRALPRLRPSRPRAGTVLGAVAMVVVMVVAVTVPLLLPVFRFPRPTGPHGVGTLTYHWTDHSRREILGPDPRAPRELMAQIWYPAQADPSAPRAPYVQDGPITDGIARLLGAPGVTFRHLRQVRTNAVAGAPAAPGRHPVLVFLTGAQGFRQSNTFQAEELASHGYVVAALDQPYTAAAVTFPGGRTVQALPRDRMSALIEQSLTPAATPPVLHGRAFPEGLIPHLARDVPFALDRLNDLDRADPRRVLTGRLDVARAGVFGVSLGGIVAPLAANLEPRLRAGLVMDARMTADVVRDGMRTPAMWLTRDAATMRREGWDEAEIEQHQTTMRAVYEKRPADGYFITMPDTFHLDYTDATAWSPLIGMLGFSGPIGAERAHTIINAYTVAFFDTYLKDTHPALPVFSGVRAETTPTSSRAPAPTAAGALVTLPAGKKAKGA